MNVVLTGLCFSFAGCAGFQKQRYQRPAVRAGQGLQGKSRGEGASLGGLGEALPASEPWGMQRSFAGEAASACSLMEPRGIWGATGVPSRPVGLQPFRVFHSWGGKLLPMLAELSAPSAQACRCPRQQGERAPKGRPAPSLGGGDSFSVPSSFFGITAHLSPRRHTTICCKPMKRSWSPLGSPWTIWASNPWRPPCWDTPSARALQDSSRPPHSRAGKSGDEPSQGSWGFWGPVGEAAHPKQRLGSPARLLY